MNKLLGSILICISAFLLNSCLPSEVNESTVQDRNKTAVDEPLNVGKQKIEKEVVDNSFQRYGESGLLAKGDVLFDEQLPHKGAKVKFAHGFINVLDGGVIKGRTDPKYNGHAANFAVKFKHEDAIYQFEVKLEGNSSGGIRIGYHMASCSIASDLLTVCKKNKLPVKLSKDVWHLVTVSRVGTHVTMRIGDYFLEGDEAKLTPEIGDLRLSVKGEGGSVSYRNLRSWKAIKK